MKNIWEKKHHFLPWLIVVAWMGIIFYLSSQPAHVSNALSKGFTESLTALIQRYFPKDLEGFALMNHRVRKYAHFFVFLGLGFCVSWAMTKTPYKKFERTIRVFIFCVLYAVFDETHQLFVPGRGAQIKDVLIDTIGASVGITIWLTLEWFIIRRPHRLTRQ